MKKTPIFLIIFLLFGFATISAQESINSSDKWTRIETDDKEFSVAIPQNNIVDAEERKYGQRLRVIAFQNGVEMELQIIKDKNIKDRLQNIEPSDNTKNTLFTVGDFTILKNEPLNSAQKFQNSFWIIRKDTLYFLKVNAKTVREKEVSRFLFSINLQGKPLFAQKEKTIFLEELISISSLKTSAEVIEVFGRKLEKNKINVTYEANSIEADYLETEGLTRKVIILERPFPTLNPTFQNNAAKIESFSVKLKVNFLANGQIGDITVLSVANKDFIKACIESAQKIRFIPAQINGKNTDSMEIVNYMVQISSVPTNVRR